MAITQLSKYTTGGGSKAEYFLSRSLPSSAGDSVELGTVALNPGVVQIDATLGDSGYSVAKTYVFPFVFTGTSGSWVILSPLGAGTYNGDDFQIEFNNGALRARRIGSVAAAGTLYVRLQFFALGTAFTPTSTAATTTAATSYYFGTPIAGNTDGTVKLSYNVGIQTTTYKTELQIGSTANSILNLGSGGVGGYLGHNVYYSSGWKRTAADYATLVTLNDGGFLGDLGFYAAGSSTADSAITWTNLLYLKNAGSVGIGTTTPGSGIASIAGTISGKVLHLQSTGVASRMVLQSDTGLADILLSYTGATSNAKIQILRNDGSFKIMPHSDDGTVALTAVTVGSYASGGNVTVAANLTVSGGTLSLNNGTSNALTFADVGVTSPSSAAGWKLVLFGTAGSPASAYGFGIDSSTLWANSASILRWYIAGTSYANLTTSGFSTNRLIATGNNTTGWHTRQAGSYTAVTAVTGAIVFEAPYAMSTAIMHIVRLRGYRYDSDGPWEATLGFYAYADNLFYNYSSYVNGANVPAIQLGRNTSTNAVSIIVGTTGTVWQFPQIELDVFQGFSNGQAGGWTSQLATSLATWTSASPLTPVTPARNDLSSPSYVTLSSSSTLLAERVLTGTSNQITLTDNGANSTVVLSTPQNIHTGATPTFAGLTLTGGLTGTTASMSDTLTITKSDATQIILKRDSSSGSSIMQHSTAGLLYLMSNASFNGTTWNAFNSGQPSWGLGLGESDNLKIYRAPAGATYTYNTFIDVDNVGRVILGSTAATTSYITPAQQSKLHLHGTDSSASAAGPGPHIWVTTSADTTYPVFQQLNWTHNNVSLNFDMYFNNAAWVSSYSGSNWQFYKLSNELQFNYASGIAAGSTISSFTSALKLTITGSAVFGNAAISTSATDGFLYMTSCAGTPTGTPTTYTGRVPLVVDSTNSLFYGYVGGSWVNLSGSGSGAPTTAQYVTLATDGTLTNERVLTGTSGQITITDGGAGGNVTLSAPGVVPVGGVVAWMKSFTNTPSLPTGWVECNGQTLSDAGSVYNTQVIPNLNNSGTGTGHVGNYFLRGGTSTLASWAGGGGNTQTGGSDTHTHNITVTGVTSSSSLCSDPAGTSWYVFPDSSGAGTSDNQSNIPIYATVVWIMRVK
jgi:hypothetical protein